MKKPLKQAIQSGVLLPYDSGNPSKPICEIAAIRFRPSPSQVYKILKVLNSVDENDYWINISIDDVKSGHCLQRQTLVELHHVNLSHFETKHTYADARKKYIFIGAYFFNHYFGCCFYTEVLAIQLADSEEIQTSANTLDLGISKV